MGATVTGMTGTARQLAARHPRQAVIDLGTNDVLFAADLSASEQQYEKMVHAFGRADTDCIHLVNLNTRMRARGTPATDAAIAFNRFLDGLADEHDHVVVIDWDGAVQDSAERRRHDPEAPRLISDTVHPTAEGSRVLAQLIRDSLDEGCRSGFF